MSSTSYNTYLYVSNSGAGSESVSVLKLTESNGEPVLTLVDTTSVEANVSPSFLKADVDKSTLYVGYSDANNSPGTKRFSIAADTGRITSSGFTAALGPVAGMEVTLDGSALFVTSGGGAPRLSSYAIDVDQSLISVDTDTAGAAPSKVIQHPTKKILYVLAVSTENRIFVEAYNVFGQFSEAAQVSTAGDTPASMAVHSNGKVLVVVHKGLGSDIQTFTMDSGGALTAGPTAPAGGNTGSYPNDVFFHPTLNVFYVINTYRDSISTYSVNPVTGAFSEIGSAVSTGGNKPWSGAVDPNGKYLIVVNTNSETIPSINGDIGLFKIDQTTGALTSTSSERVSVGLSPRYAAFARLPQ